MGTMTEESKVRAVVDEPMVPVQAGPADPQQAATLRAHHGE
jgi:hypothetical protein